MVQDIVQLPEMASITVGEYTVNIENHKIKAENLLEWILRLMTNHLWNEGVVKMKQNNISCEAVVEECVRELDENDKQFLFFIWWNYDLQDRWREIDEFSTTEEYWEITQQLIGAIRDCANWAELYETLNLKSKFNERTIQQVRRELLKCKV